MDRMAIILYFVELTASMWLKSLSGNITTVSSNEMLLLSSSDTKSL